MIRWTYSVLLMFAPFAITNCVRADVLRAADVTSPSNTDWVAFARAQKTMRAGETVDFHWQTYPKTPYRQIRRDLWLAALHGITTQTIGDEHTQKLFKDELNLVQKRLQTPFDIEVSVRDVPGVEDLYPQLIRSQTASLLFSTNETATTPTILRCQNSEVVNEGSGLVFTSIQMAVAFAQACHTDGGLVFESSGHVSTNVFVRPFKDGTATVVNLTDKMLCNLIFKRNLVKYTFDLYPAGVVHILRSNPPRPTRSFSELFATGLWQVSFEGNRTPRLVRSDLLPSIVGETYQGVVSYKTTLAVPPSESALFLHLETDESETEVLFDGRSLGVRAWDPFEWEIPLDFRGKNVPVEIRVTKRTLEGFLQCQPTWHRL